MMMDPATSVRLLRKLRDEHERTKARLRLFESIYYSAPDAILVVERDGKILHVNTQAALLFDYEPDELVGQYVEKLVPPSAQAIHRSHRSDFMCEPTTRPMGEGKTLAALRKGGEEFPCDVMLAPCWHEAGCVVIVIVRERAR